MTNETLELIKSRRVVRVMNKERVSRENIEHILEAARWAPVGGNQRFLRFSVSEDPTLIKVIRMVSPGMIQRPQAIITICADWNKFRKRKVKGHDRSAYIDVGTAMQTMLLASHSLGLGSGPVTSFNKVAVGLMLNLQSHVTPELMVCVGHQAAGYQMPMAPKQTITWESLVDWGRRP